MKERDLTPPQEGISRREFLKKAGIVAAAVAGSYAALKITEYLFDGKCPVGMPPEKPAQTDVSSDEDINEPRKFPKGFMWGSATAPFQVEGNSGIRKTDWDVFVAENNIVPLGEQGPNWWVPGNAERDLEDMKKLGLNAQRLGCEWGRIEPEQGRVNQEALRRYRELIDFLKKNGMTPVMTASHFALPEWVAKEGGWGNEKIAEWFKNYAEILADNFPDVPIWITINEPNILATVGYLDGSWPPGKKGPGGLLTVLRSVAPNMVKAHYLAGNELTKQGAKKETVQVGIANAIGWNKPEHENSELDKIPIKIFDFFNYKFLRETIDNSDFAGINFYSGYWLKFKFGAVGRGQKEFPSALDEVPFGKIVRHEEELLSDIGLPVVPEFFLEALQYIHKEFKKPIIVAENGIADRGDKLRPYYILTHLIALHEAMKRGVDIRGYYHWSTVDNLEWEKGFGPRFGLIANDPRSGERALRQSAQLYGEIAKSNEIDVNKLEKYLTPEQRELTKRFLQTLNHSV